MECYYEALVQELEESQKQMLGELQNLRIEHSTCVFTISSMKAQMETMSQDMNEQILRFAEDGHDLDSLNQELERRAITSEATRKKAHRHSLLRMSVACATWPLVTANQMQPFSNGSKQFYRGIHESESKENDLTAYVNNELREMAILGALKRSSFAVEDSPSSTDITGLLSFA
uniref:Uncharacterized protein n=1 Tax=Vitis vinifera TaxID=29760 RepID=F6HJN5_VITVI